MKGKKALSLLLITAFVLSGICIAVPSLNATPIPPYTPPAIWLWASNYNVTTQSDLTGNQFNVNVSIYNVGNSTVGLGAIQFQLWYNTSLLTAENTTLGPVATGYLADYGPINITLGYYTSTSPINQALGRIYWFADVAVLTNPFKGSGVILSIQFKIIYAPPRLIAPPATPPPGIAYFNIVTCPLKLNSTVIDWVKPVSPFPTGSYVLGKDYGVENGFYEYARMPIIQGMPTAIFTFSESIAYVGDIVTCDGSASTPGTGALLCNYTWTIAGPAYWISVGNMSVVTFKCNGTGSAMVTLVVGNNQHVKSYPYSQNITQMAKVGCITDLFTSPTRFCGQQTTFVGTGLANITDYEEWLANPTNPAYGNPLKNPGYVDAVTPDVNLTLYVSVSYNGAPRANVLVSYQIIYEWQMIDQALGFPAGYRLLNQTVDTRTAMTNTTGIAVTFFRVPMSIPGIQGAASPWSPLPFGKWLVVATTKVQEVKQMDWIRFDVGYPVWLENVTTFNPATKMATNTFYVNGTLGMTITAKNIMFIQKPVLFVATVYDICDVPIASYWIQMTALPSVRYDTPYYFTFNMTVTVPAWAYVGIGHVYVDAYTTWPSAWGEAYSPEVSNTINIKW
jgi:hypothetical protein